MATYALIPARSGSKGLPDKNIAEIAGKPLLAHAINFARKVTSIDRVFVSTDSEKYRRLALGYGAECPVLRGPLASSDTAMEEDILADVAETFPARGIPMPDIWVWLKPTSPFRSVASVETAVAILKEKPGVTSVRIVSEADARLQRIGAEGFLEPLLAVWPLGRSKARRTEFPKVYRPFNLEVFRHVEWERRDAYFMGHRIHPIIEAKWTGLDIDDADDFELLKALIEARPKVLEAYIHV